jgi:8-oxo-dGTP diphosphatase
MPKTWESINMSTLELAGCIIQQRPGQLLLLHRNTQKRIQWEIPGGKLGVGEGPEDAAVREVREELGIDVEIVEQLGVRQFEEDGYTMKYSWFRATISHGTPTVKEPQTHDEFRYFDVRELANERVGLSPNTVNFLEEVEAGRIAI